MSQRSVRSNQVVTEFFMMMVSTNWAVGRRKPNVGAPFSQPACWLYILAAGWYEQAGYTSAIEEVDRDRPSSVDPIGHDSPIEEGGPGGLAPGIVCE